MSRIQGYEIKESVLVKERNLVRLTKFDGDCEEYVVRGAIAWPNKFYPGYTLIAAQEPRTKIVWIISEWMFLGVVYYEERFDEIGNLMTTVDRGLVNFIRDAIKRLGCFKFYVQDDGENDQLLKYWRRMIAREPLVEKKPVLIKIKTPESKDVADNLITAYSNEGRIRIPGDFQLYRELEDLNDTGELENKIRTYADSIQALPALRLLLASFEKSPWREPVTDDEV